MEIVGTFDNLRKIRDFVRRCLEGYSISEIDRNLLILAIDEACTNIMKHSTKIDEELVIKLTISISQEGVGFEINHKGTFFDLANYSEPSIDTIIQTKRKGGMGIKIIRRIMDQLEYIRENDYSIIRMYKALNLRPISSSKTSSLSAD